MADHQIDDPKIAFAYLRPSCVLLTKEPILCNIQALSGHLRAVSDGALQLLQDYALFPLRFVLKTPGPKREALVQAAMEAMTYVLENTCIHSWESLRDLFSELCLCLCSPTDPGKPAPASEELKLAVLRCLDALLHSAYGDVFFKLYEPTMLPGLGAAVSLFLALAEQEKAREVQTEALKCLLSLFIQCDCSRTHLEPEKEERRMLGSALATFLPGITRALSQVIGGDVRQGHAVTVKAMRVWYTTVGLVMEDDQLQNASKDNIDTSELGRVGGLVVKRTPSWSKATSKRLTLALQKVISCTSAHQHWRVRLELVNLSDYLLARCSRSLAECTGPLLEALVGAVNDEEPRVKERCSAVLDEVARRNQANGGQALKDVLSENLHGLVSSLPRLMRTTDDKRKLFVLNVFLGYLKILGPQIDLVLTSAAHLQRISKALMQVLELDVSDVRIVEERTFAHLVDLGLETLEAQLQRKYFLYFTDDKIFSALKQICRMLGHYGNIYLLVDHFLDLYKESLAYRKQAALVLNEIITGAAGIGIHMEPSRTDNFRINHSKTNHEDLKSAVMSIVEEYISLNNWHLPTVMEHADIEQQEKLQSPISAIMRGHEGNSLHLVPASNIGHRSPTLHQLNSNIWQICIQLEGIGAFALALGSDFCLLLMTSLYPVLEKAGDESLLVSQSALGAMHNLCVACNYSSPKDLVISNADYLLNDVSLNLGRPSVHPHAPRVLAVMFAHSDATLLPLVVDVVQDLLTMLDLSYDQRSLQFSSALHSLMKAMVRWFPSSAKDHIKPPRVPPSQNPKPLDLRQFLLDYKKQKELAEGIGANEEDLSDAEMPPVAPGCEDHSGLEEGPDVKPELPMHVSVAKDVMERCVHLLSHTSIGTRLKVLGIVELCVNVLSETENELLPMVHRCWPALLQRLTNDDPLVIPQAFRVLCVLGELCGDFLRKRVSKEVLPRLTSALWRQAETSARSGPLYTHTLTYKLQLAVLQGLGPLCVRLDLVDSDLDNISEACLPYLSCRQPIGLQEACLSVFRHLMQVDPDACWFRLTELCCPTAYELPHMSLHPVRLSGMDRQRNEYTDNVLKLLHELQLCEENETDSRAEK
ncbi:TELO2-interacting protein 1 homolog isoform X2 [Pygocentrus nattereri]|uniref:TELO2-interacting protein 1 homolog n=2 Tax=Pygocentrus nattereri TaxID=42514 RepID=A0A3B4DBI8_PYGNA|nr:TELO2-interacting protein 1 homolog isoform X2 [Pygocentrus nattereri]XP_037397103.1 TELO2-interacting protein 1 homolog isoform X2 [Pygocentrus nattereri]